MSDKFPDIEKCQFIPFRGINVVNFWMGKFFAPKLFSTRCSWKLTLTSFYDFEGFGGLGRQRKKHPVR